MQKRGQVTVLIIMGIIILLIVATLIIFRENIFISEFEREQAEALLVPEQAEEIHSYVLTCVEEVALEGLDLLGSQGGYIDIPSDPIPGFGQNVFSNSLELFEGSGARTAYWFYESANGVEKDQIPSKDEMELELANYVNANLADCIDNDDGILIENNVSASGEIFTDVEIFDQSVYFTINYPITVAIDDFIFVFPNLYHDVDVNLGEMYDAAVNIMENENENFIFEDMTFDMLALNEETPVSGAGFGCDTKRWEYEEIVDSFRETLFYNVLAMKIKNTNYEVNTESEERYFELDLLDFGTGYNANVMYFQQWPLVLDVFPMEDGILEEDSYTDSGSMGGFLSSLFCLTNYNFVYDIKYPLMISLYDENSDYTFQFAIMVVLDNNQPRENELGTLEFTEESVICDSKDKLMTVYALGVEPSGLFVELEGADVNYQCVTSDCDIGQTLGIRGSASLTSYFPRCYNGNVIVEKEGYYSGSEVVSTLDSDSASVVLEKLYEYDYEIRIVDYDGNERSPTSDETIYFSLVEEEGYTATAFYPYDDSKIELIPGEYSLFATLIKEGGKGISVNGQSFEKCVSAPVLGLGGIFGLERDKCYDVELDDFNLDSLMTGGLELTWEPDRFEMDLANEVVFYVLEVGEPQDVEDLEEVYSLLEMGIGMKEPEFK